MQKRHFAALWKMKHEISWKKIRRFRICEKHVMKSLQGCGWHVAEAEISSAYRSFSNEKIMGKLGIYIGIDHVNVTLLAMPSKKIFSNLYYLFHHLSTTNPELWICQFVSYLSAFYFVHFDLNRKLLLPQKNWK